MSRMLEALKQIEAHSPRLQRALQSAPARRPTSPGEDRAPGEPRADRQGAAEGPVRDSAAIERTLDEAENLVAVEAHASGSLDWPCGPTEEHARAYGELADNVLAQLTPGRGAVLMFTSPGDGEGKTEMLVPLAAALTRRTTGEVLLVDGNLREPALASYLGIDAAAGLAAVLLGTLNWRQVVCHTAVPRLSVLPGVKLPTSHDDPPRPGSLQPLFEELRREYRLVLIDTASLAHGEVAPMGRDCDGIYLVVQLDHTTRRAARNSLRVIEACGGRLRGSIAIGDERPC